MVSANREVAAHARQLGSNRIVGTIGITVPSHNLLICSATGLSFAHDTSHYPTGRRQRRNTPVLESHLAIERFRLV